MSTSKIEWTDATWNPVIGCSPVSEGCRNCYAARMAQRMRGNPNTPDYHDAYTLGTPYDSGHEKIARTPLNNPPVFTGVVRCLPHKLDDPLRWRKPRLVFVCSMSDLFHESVPFDFQVGVFARMCLCPQHTFQVLTKRPATMAATVRSMQTLDNLDEHVTSVQLRRTKEWKPSNYSESPGSFPTPNIWLGTSVEDQATADDRIPHLLGCPATVRFLSVEPLLGPIPNLLLTGIHWVIVGCESGPKARGHDEYDCRAEHIIDQCRAAGVPVFHKQMPISGRVSHDPGEWPVDLCVREWPQEAGR